MQQHKQATGYCLCQAVTITAQTLDIHVHACHCRTCRRWGGGPFLSVDCGTDVRITGTDTVVIYASSEWAERGFCKSCGSHLFYRLKESGRYSLPVDLFDDTSSFVFNKQVFIDEKPAWYCFSNQTENLTGAELFAQYDA